MTPNAAGTPAGGISVRDLLASLTAVQALSMVMTDAPGEDEILDLAADAVPALSHRCWTEAIWLDGGWREVGSLRERADPSTHLGAEIANVGRAGGVLRSPDLGWAWAFPLSSRGGASGFLVVASPAPPPEHEWTLLHALAQQTGMVLAHSRLLARERATRARFADEQSTLRRVARLVARAVPPEEVFTAVAGEAGRLLEADFAVMSRYHEDGSATVVGAWSRSAQAHPLPVGSRLEPDGKSVHSLVFQTARSARVDDYGDDPGVGARVARQAGVRSVVGVPIHIGGRSWGVIGVASQSDEPLPLETEAWLAGFTELVAAAIANAEAQAALTASRARIVAASDEARREIERNLHDGVQQRLISAGLKLRAAQSAVPAQSDELRCILSRAAGELATAFDEVREISHGIHPAILSKGGLEPALKALCRQATTTVELELDTGSRLPDHIEVAAYYVVSEALANATKHAHASVVRVLGEQRDHTLHLSIGDDGVGGADPTKGSGLTGLRDRVEAVGGSIDVRSRRGEGTLVVVELPIRPWRPPQST
jgi:signal transduction histidine kinase